MTLSQDESPKTSGEDRTCQGTKGTRFIQDRMASYIKDFLNFLFKNNQDIRIKDISLSCGFQTFLEAGIPQEGQS